MKIAGVLVCAAALLASTASQAATVITDTTFNVADWETIVYSMSAGLSQASSQQAAGGNPGSFRQMTHTFPSNSSGTSISVLHYYTGSTYDPTASGAIASIDYSEDHIVLNPPFAGSAIGAYFILTQGGSVWYANTDLTFSNTGWQSAALSGLLASNFNCIGPCAGGPDFSATGGVIKFGVLRSNSNTGSSTSPAYTTTNGLDNFWVRINQVPSQPVPEPGTLTLLGFGLAGLGFTRRRRGT